MSPFHTASLVVLLIPMMSMSDEKPVVDRSAYRVLGHDRGKVSIVDS